MGDKPEQGWEKGWAGHERDQLLRLAKLPLEKKIEWLEEAQRLSDRLARRRGERPR